MYLPGCNWLIDDKWKPFLVNNSNCFFRYHIFILYFTNNIKKLCAKYELLFQIKFRNSLKSIFFLLAAIHPVKNQRNHLKTSRFRTAISTFIIFLFKYFLLFNNNAHSLLKKISAKLWFRHKILRRNKCSNFFFFLTFKMINFCNQSAYYWETLKK